MTRRIMIHSIGLLGGLGLGLLLAAVAESNGLAMLYGAAIIAGSIFLFQVIAYVVCERLRRPRPVVSREPTLRGTEAWGWLKPLNGLGAGFPLNRECVRIGRGVDMDLMLNNSSISRRHCEMRRANEGGIIADNGSRNGVFVNGLRVTEQFVMDGDQVSIGELKFQFLKKIGTIRPVPSPELSVTADLGVGKSTPAEEGEERREDTEKTFRSTTEMRIPRGPQRISAPELDPMSKTTDLSGEAAARLRRRESRPFDETEEYGRDDD